jgi:hypothetical protein
MKVDRAQLKLKMLHEQMQIVPGVGFKAVCPRCWENGVYSVPTNMHEGLIKKGDVQTWEEEDRESINAPENCVVLCPTCDMEESQTGEMTDWFIIYKTSLGYDLREWVKTLPFKNLPALRIARLNNMLS